MTFLIDILLFAAALILLVKGADWVTRYASNLVLRWGISEFVVGATIVAVATSLPEIFIALVSAFSQLSNPLSGTIDIASGTVIGSNIANIGLVLGIAIFLRPLGTSTENISQEKFMLMLSLLAAGLLVVGMGQAAGIFLIAVILLYTFYLLGRTRTYNPYILIKSAFYRITARDTMKDIFLSMVGGVALAVGAVLMVTSVISISTDFGLPQFLVALFAVAIGTSLPELSASIFAAIKGMRGISIGNIIGSNIINIFAIGLAATVSPIIANIDMIYIDLPVMLILSALVIIFTRTGRGLSRAEGLTFITIYAIFVALHII